MFFFASSSPLVQDDAFYANVWSGRGARGSFKFHILTLFGEFNLNVVVDLCAQWHVNTEARAGKLDWQDGFRARR